MIQLSRAIEEKDLKINPLFHVFINYVSVFFSPKSYFDRNHLLPWSFSIFQNLFFRLNRKIEDISRNTGWLKKFNNNFHHLFERKIGQFENQSRKSLWKLWKFLHSILLASIFKVNCLIFLGNWYPFFSVPIPYKSKSTWKYLREILKLIVGGSQLVYM